jgi:hypothetical protein
MENEPSKNKKPGYAGEIIFAVIVFLYACPLIPFLITLTHPRFITIYIVLLGFVIILGPIFFIALVARFLVRVWKNPKECGNRAAIVVLTIIVGFLFAYAFHWWDCAAEGMYLNLKSEDFTELRSWTQSVQIPEGKDFLLLCDPNIPSAAAKFKPLRVRVYDDEQKVRVASIIWCGGLDHAYLIVGPPDMNIPEADMRPDHVEVHKIISPGAYISIGE